MYLHCTNFYLTLFCDACWLQEMESTFTKSFFQLVPTKESNVNYTVGVSQRLTMTFIMTFMCTHITTVNQAGAMQVLKGLGCIHTCTCTFHKVGVYGTVWGVQCTHKYRLFIQYM